MSSEMSWRCGFGALLVPLLAPLLVPLLVPVLVPYLAPFSGALLRSDGVCKCACCSGGERDTYTKAQWLRHVSGPCCSFDASAFGGLVHCGEGFARVEEFRPGCVLEGGCDGG